MVTRRILSGLEVVTCGTSKDQKSQTIFLPGMLSTATEYVDAFCRYSYGQTHIVNLRGKESSLPAPSNYGLEEQAADVTRLVQELGLGRVHLVGHSVGAAVVTRVCLDDPAIATSLSLCDYLPIYPLLTDSWAGDMIADEPKDSPVVRLVHALVGGSHAKKNMVAEFGNLNIPTLILYGTEDDAFLPETTIEKVRQRCTSCVFSAVPRAGHEMFSDNPREAIRLLNTFLGKGDSAKRIPD